MRDMFVVLCGDGSSIDKGYVLHIGAEKGAETKLLRNGVAVAGTKRFPIVMGPHCNSPRQLDVQIRRRGSRIRVWLSGRRAFDYVDPKPIISGKIGLGRLNGRADFSDVVVWRSSN